MNYPIWFFVYSDGAEHHPFPDYKQPVIDRLGRRRIIFNGTARYRTEYWWVVIARQDTWRFLWAERAIPWDTRKGDSGACADDPGTCADEPRACADDPHRESDCVASCASHIISGFTVDRARLRSARWLHKDRLSVQVQSPDLRQSRPD